MKSKYIKAITLLSFITIFTACGTYAAQPGDGLGIHGLLSRIDYGGNTAYIFGSMHAGAPNWFPLAPAVEEAMERSQVFVFEYDMSLNEAVQVAVLMDFMAANQDTIGTLLPLLSQEEYTNFRQNLATFPADIVPRGQNFYNLHPFFLETAIVYGALESIGIHTDYSVDHYVLGIAQNRGVPILGLNHLVREMEHIFSSPTELALQGLANFMTWEEALQEAEVLTDNYATQNIAALEGTFTQLGDTLAEQWLYEVLVVQRSIEFAQEIQRLLQETQEPTIFFVTMGIGHMIGDTYANVFVYLEGQGFDIVELF